MSSIRNIVQLVESHLAGDHEKFVAIVRAIALDSELTGKRMMAMDLRRLVDGTGYDDEQPVEAKPLPESVSGMIEIVVAKRGLQDLVLGEALMDDLSRLVREGQNVARLAGLGLSPRRRVLLSGPPGTGKTATAEALAKALRLPLYMVRLDGIVKSYLGETAGNLRKIFDCVGSHRGVWFFDEIDALAADRAGGQDTGEIRRTVNSLLTMIDGVKVDGLLLAATNLPDIVDKAVLRRFDVHLRYGMPTAADVERIVGSHLRGVDVSGLDWAAIGAEVDGLGHSDVAICARNAVVDAVLDDRRVTTADMLREMRRRTTSA